MWEYNYTDEYYNVDELYHFGIKGMKWGHRKARPTTNYQKVARKKQQLDKAQMTLAEAKVRRKIAIKEYNNNYDYRRSAFGGKGSDVVLKKAATDSKRVDDTHSDYKQAKKEYKQAKKEYKKELKKENTQLAGKKVVLGRKNVNKMLNTHKGMTLEQAKRQQLNTEFRELTSIAVGAAIRNMRENR